jgi:hypothetical protein
LTGGDLAGGERRSGSLERAVDRRNRRIEQLGDLGRPPAQDLSQDQHGSLSGREVLQGGDEGKADRLA